MQNASGSRKAGGSPVDCTTVLIKATPLTKLLTSQTEVDSQNLFSCQPVASDLVPRNIITTCQYLGN